MPPLGVEHGACTVCGGEQQIDVAVQLQRVVGEIALHRVFGLHGGDAGLAQVGEQLRQRLLQRRCHALAIHASTAFEQHRAFLLDQFVQGRVQPALVGVVGRIAPVRVFIEKALEQAMRQAAEQQRSVGNVGQAAAAQFGVVVQHPLVGVVVGLGQTAVGLDVAAGQRLRQLPPASFRRQRLQRQRRQRQLQRGDGVLIAVQQSLVQRYLLATRLQRRDAPPQRMSALLFGVNDQHQTLAAIEHRPLPSASLGSDARLRSRQMHAGGGQLPLFDR